MELVARGGGHRALQHCRILIAIVGALRHGQARQVLLVVNWCPQHPISPLPNPIQRLHEACRAVVRVETGAGTNQPKEMSIDALEKVTVTVDLSNEPLPMATPSVPKVSNWFPKCRYSS